MMTKDQKLLTALEFITEGDQAVLPGSLSREIFSTESFRQQSARLKVKSKPWTQGAGIQGIGIGRKVSEGRETDDIVLRVYVEKKKAKKSLKNLVPGVVSIPELGDYQTDVLEIGKVVPESQTTRLRPAMPGCGLSHTKVTVGTFGCLVRKKNGGRSLYILSNSHVLANGGLGHEGDPIVQPGKLDGGRKSSDVLGTLHNWVPFTFSGTGYPNLIDAAIARTRASKVSKVIRLLGAEPVGVSNALRRGMSVKKVGRTTDLTTGVVSDINYRTSLKYTKQGGRKGRVGFKDQVLCTRYTAGGDSGSVVLNNRNRIVGLHFAGSSSTSVFHKIKHVFELLEIELA